ADLAPAHGRDDAVRAFRVAAHRDLHPGLEAPLRLQWQRGREGALLPGSERAALDPVTARAEPLREVRDRARPERDVDEGVELEEPLPLGLRVAAAHGDHLRGIARLQRLRVPEVRRESFIRLLADRAG